VRPGFFRASAAWCKLGVIECPVRPIEAESSYGPTSSRPVRYGEDSVRFCTALMLSICATITNSSLIVVKTSETVRRTDWPENTQRRASRLEDTSPTPSLLHFGAVVSSAARRSPTPAFDACLMSLQAFCATLATVPSRQVRAHGRYPEAFDPKEPCSRSLRPIETDFP